MARPRRYNRFNRWAKAGVWLKVFEALAAGSPGSMYLIDNFIIRVHQHAAGVKKGGPDHAIGRSRGGLSTKINALVDQDGLPLRIVLSADKAAVEALIDVLKPARALVADRGYYARAVIDLVATRGGCTHIPTKKDREIQRSIDSALYRQRNVVERYFCKLKHFRRIATRFDKLARNFLAAVTLASARLWLRAYESRT